LHEFSHLPGQQLSCGQIGVIMCLGVNSFSLGQWAVLTLFLPIRGPKNGTNPTLEES